MYAFFYQLIFYCGHTGVFCAHLLVMSVSLIEGFDCISLTYKGLHILNCLHIEPSVKPFKIDIRVRLCVVPNQVFIVAFSVGLTNSVR